jgi:endo-1,4-beta-xylanase
MRIDSKMFSLKSTILAFLTFSAVAHSQQFQIQNWGNGEDTTNYTYKSLAAGRFTLDWVLGPGGNFVAGKGYKGSQNLFVVRLMYIDRQLTPKQCSKLHSKL